MVTLRYEHLGPLVKMMPNNASAEIYLRFDDDMNAPDAAVFLVDAIQYRMLTWDEQSF